MTAERLAPFLGVLFLLTLVGLLVHDLGGTDGKPLSPEAPKHEAVQARAQLQSERSRFLLIAQQELDARLEAERAEAARQAAERQKAVEAEKRRRAAMERRTVTGTTQPRTGHCGGTLPPCSVMACESGGSLTAENPRSTASGKWQITNGTWGRYGGYARAKDAPESVQDDKARQLWAGGRGAFHWRSCL